MSRHRRGVLALAALLLLAASGCAASQAMPIEHKTIAFLRAVPELPLGPGGAPASSSAESVVLAELRSLGFVSGNNLRVLQADPQESYLRPADAARAVRQWRAEGADLIVAFSSSGAAAAREADPEAVVLFLSNDPLATGLLEDAQTPEGNLTGCTYKVPTDRTLELAGRAIPGLARIGLAYPPDDPAAVANRDALAAAADGSGLQLVTAEFTGRNDLGAAVAELAAADVDALMLSTSPTATLLLSDTEEAAERHGLPVVANTGAVQTAVLSLHPDPDELRRQLGRQAARLLSGSSPASVPVEDPRRFVLTVNARAAAQHGIQLPPDLLREANLVIL